MPGLLPDLPLDLQQTTPPAQTVLGAVNQLRQQRNKLSDVHADSFESLQQQADSNGNLIQAVVGYLQGLTQTQAGIPVSQQLIGGAYTLTGAFADVDNGTSKVSVTLAVPGTWLILAIADCRAISPYLIQIQLMANGNPTLIQQFGSPTDPSVFPLWTFGFYVANSPGEVITLQARYAAIGVGSFLAGSTTPGTTLIGAACFQQQSQQ